MWIPPIKYNYFTKQTKKDALSKRLGRTDMSVVPPKFRNSSALTTIRESCTHSDIASLDNGGNLRWSLLRIICSVQSSKATSILPSRKFSPTTFSLFIRNSMYSSSSMLLSVIVIYKYISLDCYLSILYFVLPFSIHIP